MNIIARRFLVFSLSFLVVFSSVTSANAATSVGGWTALDTITAGATNTINAVKGAGATGMRSVVAVAPSAVKLGKNLIKGGGSVALAFAMVELADGAIDWVLDPANNRVKVKVPPVAGSYFTESNCATVSSTPEGVCAKAKSIYLSPSDAITYIPNAQGGACEHRFGAFAVVPVAASCGGGVDNYRYIPIDTVATKVIANAEAGHAPSQEAVKATALEGFAAGEYDAALNASAVPDSSVDTDTPPVDTPTEPVKPFDPSSIIDAINSLKVFLSAILSSITSLSDFFQSSPPVEDKNTEIDILVPDVAPADTDINFGGSCPANFEVNSSIFGNPINITLLDMSKFCGFLSTFVKFPVYAVSSLYALYLLGGRKDV